MMLFEKIFYTSDGLSSTHLIFLLQNSQSECIRIAFSSHLLLLTVDVDVVVVSLSCPDS